MRVLVLALILASFSVMGAFAQSAPVAPAVVVTPVAAGLTTGRPVQISGLGPDESDVIVLFDPSGQQTVMHSQADSSGAISLSLQPPNGSWQVGMYRIAVGRPDGSSVSATFIASDGVPHLFAEPNLPSPTSALNFVGIGLPANQQLDLHLHLTGGQVAIETVPITTDANGAFSVFVWPQQFGLPFFAAGNYLVTLPSASLSTPFTLREHPVSANPSVSGPVLSGTDLPIHFQNYSANAYVWGLYADMQGNDAGEFLVGPVAAGGQADARIPLPALAPGQYLLATPYDWGETTFTVLQPTSTATPTATSRPRVVDTATPNRARPTVTVSSHSRPTQQQQAAKQREARAAAARKTVFCRKHWWWHRCAGYHHKPAHKKHRA
jgi:hypothetical protein